MNKLTLPNAVDIEKAIVGALLLDNDAFAKIIGLLKPIHFYDRKLRIIYETILNMYNTNIPFDTLTLYENLKALGFEKEVGGVSAISKLTQAVTSSMLVPHHAKIIVEHYMRRWLYEQGQQMSRIALNIDEDVFDQYNEQINDLEDMLSSVDYQKDEINFVERMQKTIAQINEERTSDKKEVTIQSQRFPSFNHATGGLRKQNLLVVSGYSKMGKTTFSTAFMLDLATEQKLRIGIISLEMEEFEMDIKSLSLETGTRYGYLRNPKEKNKDGTLCFSDRVWHNFIQRAHERFLDTHILLCDKPLNDIEIKAKVKNWVKNLGVQIVMIDYFQLIICSRKFDRTDREFAHISRSLKLLSKEMNIPILIVSQENDEGKTAESKALQKDCDFWLSITHPVELLEKKERKVIKINGNEFEVDQSHYLVTVKGSRHSQGGLSFMCQFNKDGSFVETYI